MNGQYFQNKTNSPYQKQSIQQPCLYLCVYTYIIFDILPLQQLQQHTHIFHTLSLIPNPQMSTPITSSHKQQQQSNFTNNGCLTPITSLAPTSIERKPKCPTFVSSASNLEDSLELLKISYKKQTDRRNKLKKLLDKYTQIYMQEKKHVKQIKAAIIEMKDTTTTCKLKVLIDPSILVDNMIKTQTREFLCTLMNTFYKTYEDNEKNNQTIGNLNNTMSYLIKGISYNEDMIFLMQKTQINEQVQLEGQLLSEKNKIKEQTTKKKQVKQIYESIFKAYSVEKQKHEKKVSIIQQLEKQLRELTQQSESMDKNIQYQQNLRNQCKDKIDREMLYQQKLGNQLTVIKDDIDHKSKQSKKLLKKLFDCRVKVANSQLRKSMGKANKTMGEQAKQKLKFNMYCQFESIRG